MAKDHKSGLGRGIPSLLRNTKEDEKGGAGVDNLINSNSSLPQEENNYSDDENNIKVRIRESYFGNNNQISQRDNEEDNKSKSFKKDEIKNEKNYSNLQNKKFTEIDIALIEPNPEQPRKNFKEEKLQELANSINDKGVLEPILVRQVNGGKYQIIAGERRWQASRIAKKTSIPAVVLEIQDNDALETSLIENIQRDDLNPIEEAYAYKRLMDKMNYTQAELAKAVSKGRSTIANAIRLLDLPEKAQEAMFNGQITAGHARAILSIPNENGRNKLVERITKEKMNVRETETLARLLSMKPSAVKTKTKTQPSEYKAIAKSLREVLKTNVKIKTTKNGNKLEISFNDEKELRSIYEKLSESNED